MGWDQFRTFPKRARCLYETWSHCGWTLDTTKVAFGWRVNLHTLLCHKLLVQLEHEGLSDPIRHAPALPDYSTGKHYSPVRTYESSLEFATHSFYQSLVAKPGRSKHLINLYFRIGKARVAGSNPASHSNFLKHSTTHSDAPTSLTESGLKQQALAHLQGGKWPRTACLRVLASRR